MEVHPKSLLHCFQPPDYTSEKKSVASLLCTSYTFNTFYHHTLTCKSLIVITAPISWLRFASSEKNPPFVWKTTITFGLANWLGFRDSSCVILTYGKKHENTLFITLFNQYVSLPTCINHMKKFDRESIALHWGHSFPNYWYWSEKFSFERCDLV